MRQTIRDLVASVDPYVKLDADAEDMLLSVASEFVESTTNFAARLARHRGAESLEVKDLQLHLEKQHAIRVPGFATQDDIGKAPAFRGQNLPAGLSSNPGASSGNASNMNASSTTSAAMGVNAVTNLAGAGVSTAGIGGTTSVGVGGPIGAGGSAGNPSASGAGVGTGTTGSGTAKGKEKAPPPAPTLRSKRLTAVKQAQSQTK
ncbi:hypothetical protein DL93DRAFT_2078089 [Clavulina sp. PMI_390]|nr:hypothetical protein DL93DRAFT_2078089 [Clavulina sp. PMI_390]